MSNINITSVRELAPLTQGADGLFRETGLSINSDAPSLDSSFPPSPNRDWKPII